MYSWFPPCLEWVSTVTKMSVLYTRNRVLMVLEMSIYGSQNENIHRTFSVSFWVHKMLSLSAGDSQHGYGLVLRVSTDDTQSQYISFSFWVHCDLIVGLTLSTPQSHWSIPRSQFEYISYLNWVHLRSQFEYMRLPTVSCYRRSRSLCALQHWSWIRTPTLYTTNKILKPLETIQFRLTGFEMVFSPLFLFSFFLNVLRESTHPYGCFLMINTFVFSLFYFIPLIYLPFLCLDLTAQSIIPNLTCFVPSLVNCKNGADTNTQVWESE